MSKRSIHLITGATGTVGSRVVERLLERGERPRIFVRDAAKARARFGERVDVALGDLADASTMTPALAGVDALFLVNSGPGLEARDAAAAAVAKAAGANRVVKLSSMDVEQNTGTGAWHARGEAAIRASGIAHTFVQPSGFMANALFWAPAIRHGAPIRSSTGDGKIAFIHTDDIADVAVAALSTRAHDGESIPISGPHAFSYKEMLEKIGAAIGKRIAFESISDHEAREQARKHESSEEMIEAHVGIWRAIREGRLARVSPNVERVLGRSPISFDRWLKENIAAFGGM
jgi:uncharacterized protein YbjT (DUF2867 family)